MLAGKAYPPRGEIISFTPSLSRNGKESGKENYLADSVAKGCREGCMDTGEVFAVRPSCGVSEGNKITCSRCYTDLFAYWCNKCQHLPTKVRDGSQLSYMHGKPSTHIIVHETAYRSILEELLLTVVWLVCTLGVCQISWRFAESNSARSHSVEYVPSPPSGKMPPLNGQSYIALTRALLEDVALHETSNTERANEFSQPAKILSDERITKLGKRTESLRGIVRSFDVGFASPFDPFSLFETVGGKRAERFRPHCAPGDEAKSPPCDTSHSSGPPWLLGASIAVVGIERTRRTCKTSTWESIGARRLETSRLRATGVGATVHSYCSVMTQKT